VLAVLNTVASYAWLAINTAAVLRGPEVELVSDSLYLEISRDATGNYSQEVSFDSSVALKGITGANKELSLVTYGTVPAEGALLIDRTQVDLENAHLYGTAQGTYNGSGIRFYEPVDSEIGGGKENLLDVTDKISYGQSILGYYVVEEKACDAVATTDEEFYYVKTSKSNGNSDYSCIGNFEVGEALANRLYWGYSASQREEFAEPDNIINVVSMDTPTEEYSLKKTVYLRGAYGTGNAKDLRVSSVEVGGRRNYLTDAIRIMFVATSSKGGTVTTIYSHRDPAAFNGALFENLYGDGREVVTVDMYIYFDGRDEDAHNNAGLLSAQAIDVHFAIDDHIYN
jgi:hypothetical protein